MTSEGHGEARWFTPAVFARLAAAGYLQSHAMPLVSKWPATFELNGFLFDLPERTTACSVVVRSRPLGRRGDKQNNPNRSGQQSRQGD